MDRDTQFIFEAYAGSRANPVLQSFLDRIPEMFYDGEGEAVPTDEFIDQWKGMVDKATYDKLYLSIFGKRKIKGIHSYNRPYTLDYIITDWGDSEEEELAYNFESELISVISKAVNDQLISQRQYIEFGIDGGQGEGSYVVMSLETLKGDKLITDKGGQFYHITSAANRNKIEKQGLIPKGARDPSISYTPRIFLFSQLPNEKELIRIGTMIQGTPGMGLAGPQSDFTGQLALYKVTVPSGYNIYSDPHSPTSGSVYVDKKIHPQNLQFIKQL